MKSLVNLFFFFLLFAFVSCKKENLDIYAPIPEAVDLGLSVKWASFNIGASSPEDFGRYFSWGDVSGVKSDGNTIPELLNSDTSYNLDENGNLVPDNDAAHNIFGDSWRMPTKDEMLELINNCSREWVSGYNGKAVKGVIFTSKVKGYTGISIFLPAAGRFVSNCRVEQYCDSDGFYWSSTNNKSSYSYSLDIYSQNVDVSNSSKTSGYTIRAVKP